MAHQRRLLPLFLLPFSVTLVLLIVGLFIDRPRLAWAGVIVLWVSSTSLVSAAVMRATEGWAERVQAVDAHTADAIVALSAGRLAAPGRSGISEWNDPDRFFGGIELFQAGKAPLLIFTGSVASWGPTPRLEGEILTEYALALGIPADRIVTTGRVANTADEAQAVASLLRQRQVTQPRILLVTSAFHMLRAQRLFEREGLVVFPFRVDFQVSAGRALNVSDFLPRVGALAQTQLALREIYARVFYRV